MRSLPWRSLRGEGAWRDAVRADVLEALVDPDGVLVVDETAFERKDEHWFGFLSGDLKSKRRTN